MAPVLVSIGVKVTVLVGGVGGARFLLGVQHVLGLGQFAARGGGQFAGPDSSPAPGSSEGHDLIAIVNVGDDAWMHGVRICPDLDTCMYTLGGGIDPERGWGHRGETWHAMEELAAYGVQPDWFSLGDRDLATHLVRSQMLRAGYPLSQVTEALCQRWKPGARLLPASDDRSETHVVITDPSDGGDRGREEQERHRAIHFQEWWVRFRAKVPTHSFAFIGADDASAGPGVAEAITDADIVFVAPSNPVVSIGAILAIPGVRAALRSTRAPVIGYSPIVSGKPLRGMADECLRVIGVASTSEAVGHYYGARSGTGILDGWLIHDDDSAEIPGITVHAIPLLMTNPAATAEMVRSGLHMAGMTSKPRS
jgi:LPPG:FO 2-phospho-L-lactate transferase